MIEKQWIQKHKTTLIVGCACFLIGWTTGYLHFKNSYAQEMAERVFTQIERQQTAQQEARARFDEESDKFNRQFKESRERFKEFPENASRIKSGLSSRGSEQ